MKLKYEFEFMEMDGKQVAIPLGNDCDFNGIITLNETAADIFRLLSTDTTAEKLVDALSESYDADRSTIETYVNDYLEQLRADGLLVD